MATNDDDTVSNFFKRARIFREYLIRCNRIKFFKPDPVKLQAAFGSYVTSYVVKDGQLEFTRKLVVRQATIPVAGYADVRSFFEKIRAAEQSPVVLVRK